MKTLFWLFFACITCSGVTSAQTPLIRIPISTSMIQAGGNTAALLFDQNVNTYWFPGWEPNAYPATVKIDLGQTYRLKNIRIWDGNGEPRLRIQTAEYQTGPYVTPWDQTLSLWQQWQAKAIDQPARYLTITLADLMGDKVLAEVEIWADEPGATWGGDGEGSPGGDGIPPTAAQSAMPMPPNALRKGDALKIAVNGFHWVPTDRLQPFAFYREYQMWRWMELKERQNRFSPTDQAEAMYDEHYTELKAKGIMPIPCVNTTPEWLTKDYPFSNHLHDYRPVRPWENALDPKSYDEMARFFWQMAARYGRKAQPGAKLTIDGSPRWANDAPLNQAKSSLDLLNYIEVWNEPDKWWTKPSNAYFEPEHYAAMLSACYDGHEGMLGEGFGIKNADPTMKVVMAGLSNFDLAYLQRMVAWCTANRRDKRFPADILNFHHYSNANGGLFQAFVAGVSPEQDKLRDQLKQMVTFCKLNIPGKPVWFSEFGYDTWQGSPQRAVPFSSYNVADVQGMWLQRSYLEAIAAGVDLAFAFNICDEPNTDALFGSSGLLLNQSQNFAKKASWFKVQQLADQLNGLTFQEDKSPDATVRVYRFIGTDKKSTYAAWSVDGMAKTIPFSGVPGGTLSVDAWPKFVKE